MQLLLTQVEEIGTTSWPVLLAAGLVTALCVLIHFETLRWVVSRLLQHQGYSARLVIIVMVLTLLVVHLIEVTLYACAYRVLLGMYGHRVGDLIGEYDGSLLDTFYLSIAVYTTVGFGDIVPEGPLRTLVGVEALAGLMLVTWSASFTFLVMQNYWEGLIAASKKSNPE